MLDDDLFLVNSLDKALLVLVVELLGLTKTSIRI